MLAGAHCETNDKFHPGLRAQRSAAVAVGVTIAQTQEAWSQGRMAGALIVGLTAAPPRMPSSKDAERRPGRKPGPIGGRFHKRQGSEAQSVVTGLPGGSLISSALSAIYIAEIHKAVEAKRKATEAPLQCATPPGWWKATTSAALPVSWSAEPQSACDGREIMRSARKRPKRRPCPPPASASTGKGGRNPS